MEFPLSYLSESVEAIDNSSNKKIKINKKVNK